MKSIKIFLPLLLFYIFLILIFSSNELVGDETRYIKYATNLLEGYYSPKDDIELVNGPGYPIVLLPFIVLKMPLMIAKLMNSIFLFMAILYFYHTLCLYSEKQSAVFYTYLLGIYPPILVYLPLLLTEVLAFLLVCGFIFYFCKLYQNNYLSWRQLLCASFYLSFLALTRTIFGYVILFGLLFLIILYLFTKTNAPVKSSLSFMTALIFCSPYLIYTYSLTGKVFYWGTNGGEQLYWISTPYENDLGEWHSRKRVYEMVELSENHLNFYDEIESLSGFEKDNKFKAKAIENIAHHPLKYLKNWIANIGRLLFNYPYSYTPQKITTYFYIIPNMFLIVVSLLCIYPCYLGRRLVPHEIKVLIVFALIYIGGSSLLPALTRYFAVIVPVIVLWISFAIARFVKLEIHN